MPELVVHVEGFDQVIAVLDRWENPDWSRLLDLIGLTIEEQTVNHFQQQAGPEGVWEPRRDNNFWPLLIKTGTLRGSITHTVLDNHSVAIGTDVFYGVFHQFGTRFMPARAFLGLTDSDKDELSTVVENFIDNLMAGGE